MSLTEHSVEDRWHFADDGRLPNLFLWDYKYMMTFTHGTDALVCAGVVVEREVSGGGRETCEPLETQERKWSGE